MALGYCEAVLLGLEQIAKENDPQFKLTPIGFMEALRDPDNYSVELEQSAFPGDGHQRDVRVRYLVRGVESEVSTSKNCTVPAANNYRETTVSISRYNQIAVSLSVEQISKYCSEASDVVRFGAPATPFMREHLKHVMTKLNALRSRTNRRLLQDMATNFSPKVGKPATATDVRFLGTPSGSLGTNYPIWEGPQEVMQDYQLAELSGTPILVGFGNLNRWAMAMNFACCNDGGIDLDAVNSANMFKYYKDLLVDSEWGANHFAVIAPGSVQLLHYAQNKGSFAGKIGASEYATIPDPTVNDLDWDIQLDFDTCTKTFNLIISNTTGLFVLPSDVYGYGDRLTYNNVAVDGAFRYRATTA